MSKIDDGGPAFPTAYWSKGVMDLKDGMTRHQWLVGQGLRGMAPEYLAAYLDPEHQHFLCKAALANPEEGGTANIVIEACNNLADAVIAHEKLQEQ